MALRILLADDEKEFVETLAERLTLRGHATRVVYDGPSALAAVEDEVPDVAVLDLLMPGLPGDECRLCNFVAPCATLESLSYYAVEGRVFTPRSMHGPSAGLGRP